MRRKTRSQESNSNTKNICTSTRSRKPFLDKTNEIKLRFKRKSNEKNVVKKKVEVQIQEQPNKIFNTVRVSIYRDATTENKVKCLLNKLSPEKRVSNTYDVYDFDYDPKLEPKRPVKKKIGSIKKKYIEELDTSGEPDNSMKPIMKKLRKVHKRKEKQKDNATVEIPVLVDNNNSGTENVVVDKINEPSFKNSFTNNPVITSKAEKTPEIIAAYDQSVGKSAADELADITRSFLEDLSDEDGDFIVTTPTHVDIISKMIMRKHTNPKQPPNQIFNSTLNSSKVVSSPWRINVSTISKKPQFFNVKDKSFTPSYNPDIMNIKSTIDLSSSSASTDLGNRIKHKLNNTKHSTHNKIQTSLLNFVTGSSTKQIEGTKSRLIFEDITSEKKYPAQKILGELHFNQSTPIRLNANISPKKKSSDNSLFGFSFISDTENLDDSENKENRPTRISINEIKKVVFNKKPVVVNREPEKDKVETVTEHIPAPVDDNISVCLFDDPVDAVKNTKASTLILFYYNFC